MLSNAAIPMNTNGRLLSPIPRRIAETMLYPYMKNSPTMHVTM